MPTSTAKNTSVNIFAFFEVLYTTFVRLLFFFIRYFPIRLIARDDAYVIQYQNSRNEYDDNYYEHD